MLDLWPSQLSSHNRAEAAPARYGWLCLRFVAFLAAAHFLAIKEFILWLGGMGDGKPKWALVSLPGLLGLLGFLSFLGLLQGGGYAFCDLLFDEIGISSSFLCGRFTNTKLFIKPPGSIGISLNFRLFLWRFSSSLFYVLDPFSRISIFLNFPG